MRGRAGQRRIGLYNRQVAEPVLHPTGPETTIATNSTDPGMWHHMCATTATEGSMNFITLSTMSKQSLTARNSKQNWLMRKPSCHGKKSWTEKAGFPRSYDSGKISTDQHAKLTKLQLTADTITEALFNQNTREPTQAETETYNPKNPLINNQIKTMPTLSYEEMDTILPRLTFNTQHQ